MSEHPIDVLREWHDHDYGMWMLTAQGVQRSNEIDAALRAVEQLERRTRECRDAMRAERVDVLMANGPIFLDMLDEGLALFDRKEQTPCHD